MLWIGLLIIGICLFLISKAFDITFYDWLDLDNVEQEYIIDSDGNYLYNPNYRRR